jgi:hypothetical protein
MQVLGVSLDTLMSPEEEGEEEQEGEGEELETLSAVQSITATPTMCLGKTRGGILGHQFERNTIFCSMLFTVLSTGGFYRKPYSCLFLKTQIKNKRKKQTQVYS